VNEPVQRNDNSSSPPPMAGMAAKRRVATSDWGAWNVAVEGEVTPPLVYVMNGLITLVHTHSCLLITLALR
jgi:hypothetical protein